MSGLETIAAIASVASTALGAIGGFQQAKYQQAVAERNAQAARQASAQTQIQARIEAQEQDIQTRALIGEQLAIQGASGIDVDSPTSLLVRKSAARLGRQDVLNVIHAGNITARNQLIQAQNFDAEARLAGREAGFSLVSGFLGAASQFGPGGSARSLIGRSRPRAASSVSFTRL